MAEKAFPTDHSSRLLELLRRVGREESGTVGFGRPRQGAARRAALMLAAALPAATPDYLAAARDAGADTAFVPVTTDVAAAASTSDGASWPVCGLARRGQMVTPADLDNWQAAGIDAVACLPHDALAACFSPRRQGLLALLDHGLPLDRLRAAAALTVDAFVLQDASAAERLTGDDLLWLTLAGGLVRGPAVLLSARIVADDLEALVAVGLSGIAVYFGDTSTVEQVRHTLAELRRAVDSLDPHLRQGRRERTGLGPVTLPATSQQGDE